MLATNFINGKVYSLIAFVWGLLWSLGLCYGSTITLGQRKSNANKNNATKRDEAIAGYNFMLWPHQKYPEMIYYMEKYA